MSGISLYDSLSNLSSIRESVEAPFSVKQNLTIVSVGSWPTGTDTIKLFASNQYTPLDFKEIIW